MVWTDFNKFKNKKTNLDGRSFSSKLEASVYALLKLRLLAGEISEIQCQDHVRVCGPFGHECYTNCKVELVVDFKCTRPDGTSFWVEAKGVRMPEYQIKRRLWMHYKIGRLEVWMGSFIRPTLAEVIGEE